MNVLAIDSSSGTCSVAIIKNGAIASYKEDLSASAQARSLVLMVEAALKESQTSYDELASVAVTIGPGSFTGIRIALATARGIGFAASIPVFGFSGLQVMALAAESATPDMPVVSIMNAGKGEIIYQIFSSLLSPLCQPQLTSASNLEELAKKYNNEHKFVGYTSNGSTLFPRADLLAMLATKYPQFSCPPVPFYVRPPDAKPQINYTPNSHD